MIPETGIGIMYLPGIENLIESFSGKLDVIECEPQTTWYKKSIEDDSFRFDPDIATWLKSHGKPVIFHGVGFPVGGTLMADENHFNTMNQHIEAVQPVYISEHLSFNTYRDQQGTSSQVNFLLPCVQNEWGIQTAVENIRNYKKNITLPFAFETGVNYFQPIKNELPDGYFFREIAEQSDSYILLDIHNLLVNQVNGRQKIDDLIRMLPLDRVTEIHLAGGFFYNNYYLDAHSSISSDELFDITRSIVKQLPKLTSMIFEAVPEYYGRTITDKDIEKQLDQMSKIWEERGKQYKISSVLENTSRSPFTPSTPAIYTHSVTPGAWEQSLGGLINGKPLNNELTGYLAKDPGLGIIQDLIFEFRASAVVTTLKMSCRYIRLMKDSLTLENLLKEFCSQAPSEIFGLANGQRFATYIKDHDPGIPYLNEIIHFELSSLQATIDGQTRTLELPFDPNRLIACIENNIQPEWDYTGTIYQVKLTGDGDDEKEEKIIKLEGTYHK